MWFLSGVAGAMITTAGVVFSLTVVSLQLASGQFSPRVLRTFVRDRLSQVVIGLLVATFLYCTLVLRFTRQDEPFVPALPIGIALVLVVATVILIIAHLDHLARSLQVGEVLRRISVKSAEVIEDVCRESPEERPHAAAVDVGALGAGLVVNATRDGWVNQNPSHYMFAAMPPKTIVRLETRGGAYVSKGQPLATLWPKPPDPQKVRRRIASAVEVGDERTMQEDIDFGLRQLVDIGLRALSPAVNDPTTATEVVLRIGSVLCRLLVCDLPPEAVAGSGGKVLLRPWALNHDEYVEHTFDELRLAGPTQLRVVTTMLRTLRMLVLTVEEAGRSGRRRWRGRCGCCSTSSSGGTTCTPRTLPSSAPSPRRRPTPPTTAAPLPTTPPAEAVAARPPERMMPAPRPRPTQGGSDHAPTGNMVSRAGPKLMFLRGGSGYRRLQVKPDEVTDHGPSARQRVGGNTARRGSDRPSWHRADRR